MAPRRTALLTLLKLTDLLIVTVCLGLAATLGAPEPYAHAWRSPLQMEVTVSHVLLAAAYLLLWHVVLNLRGLYRSYRLSPVSRELRDLLATIAIATAPLAVAGSLLGFRAITPQFLVAFVAATVVGLGFGRRLLRVAAGRIRCLGRNLRDVVIVGDGSVALETATRLAQREALGYRVVEVLALEPEHDDAARAAHATALLARLGELLDRKPIDEIFFASSLDQAQPLVSPLIALCEELGVTLRVVAQLAPLDWARASLDALGGQPVLTISSAPPESICLVAKRLIDVAASAVGLVLLAPLFLAIAIAIKLESGGPVLFAQTRVGLNRHRFRMLKFRTMVVDAEESQAALEHLNEAAGPVFKIARDPRITRLGAWLRRLSLDELPQLVNVLIGDMSLVGPRPLPLRDVDRMDVRWHQRRFSVKPGITCSWQVESRQPEFEQWIRSDIEYIQNWSLGLDLKILARTLPAVIAGNGAW
jgi:exopolysaccharide biosynthesis polyprenyl glycosylphosphotransferase